jgi:Bacterial SH3 domain
MMRFATLAGSLLVLLGGAALAAQGDPLVVTGDVVNVRAGPESNAPILRQVDRDAEAVELARQGNWVQVRLPDRDTVGWIHGSLLATVVSRPAVEVAAPAPLAAPQPQAPAAPVAGAQPSGAAGQAEPDQMAAIGDPATATALAQFRATVSELNDRALAAAGVDLFTGVRVLGDGVVQVTATDAWTVVPEGGQQSYMNALLGYWLAAAGSERPLRLQIVDHTGQVLGEQSGP